ncbi:mucin-5AC-like [Pelobates fuscus]|uniref:mucin-5AC-like n=1 Tax=Pelobates fuscus TaxID=191477 RepID=UPI002FE4D399
MLDKNVACVTKAIAVPGSDCAKNNLKSSEDSSGQDKSGAKKNLKSSKDSSGQDTSDQNSKSSKLIFISPTTPPVFRSLSSAHNSQVCSTWGNYHFKTFDGDIFYYPGTCNYLYASNCHSNFEEFNIQIRRSVVEGLPTISGISMKIDGVFIELKSGSITFNGDIVEMPYAYSGIQIDRRGMYIRVNAKLGLEFMWNEDDAVLLELDTKFANQTCGLCGDFNGIPIYNEFISNNVQLTGIQYGNLQKYNGPTETCLDLTMTVKDGCTDLSRICEVTLTSSAFSSCNKLVDPMQYINACVQDLCRCAKNATGFCLCNTFTEYSRQCAHAGGVPGNWRTDSMCPLKCNQNLQYKECGNPCPNTCTNLEHSSVCDSHCIDGCFCPEGTVYDDIKNVGCIPRQQCSCSYNGHVYAAGTGFSEKCQSCTCADGKWKCAEDACLGSCSVVGGSHITSFDATQYTFHGDCSYVLAKTCNRPTFSILGEILQCGLTNTETCLKSITLILDGGNELIYIKPCGSVYVNSVFTQLPVSTASVTIFKPSTFFIIVQTAIGVQIQVQLVPMMQVYLNVDPSYSSKLCGLCGNFNKIQADDFTVLSGVVEGTGSSFANTWKTQADCPNVKNSFENPCSLSIENEQYAEHWCALITDPNGPFAACHLKVNPTTYQSNCMFDTCNCENTEDCMCAALSSYAHACSSAGIVLKGWRKNICNTYTSTCPKTLMYSYHVRTCQSTCRSLSEHDITCDISFVPVDGCICQNGTYLDDSGVCVLPTSCPCYYKGTAVPPGEVVHDNGALCTCTKGKLDCMGEKPQVTSCSAPMFYFDCTNKTAGTKGSECQKSCQTLDMNCYSTQCVSGCMCPAGYITDGKGGCVTEDQCPCLHNNEVYLPGAKINMKCNTCVCRKRNWDCTTESCMSTCSVYGDGHYVTFDSKRYSFNGDCEYTLAQDYCGDSAGGSFRIITENIPCGTTGTTCSKSIKVYLGNTELILAEDNLQVVQRNAGQNVPYKVHQMGIYMVIEAVNGLVLTWDQKTSIYIKLESNFKGKVCGLCGNYDGNSVNDFTTRSFSVVGDVIEFGNSWKLSPSCLDSVAIGDPCSSNLYRKAWSQRQCSVITSETFAACHPLVNPINYYDACVNDACACDTGGDCECFCTAVAAYAQACSEAGACVTWRSPTMCPVFCDYYNSEGHCEWHYKSCGAPCMKTCRNRAGTCYHKLSGLEGCYPSCPEDRPYFDEETMKCVPACNCYDKNGTIYNIGDFMPREDEKENCTTWTCTKEGKQCTDHGCIYEKRMYKDGDIIYNTTDGIGGCIIAICVNSTINRTNSDCYQSTTTVSTTTFVFSTTSPITTTSSPVITVCSVDVSTVSCNWTDWYDVTYPKYGNDKGDFETFENIRKFGYNICDAPQNIECRAKEFPDEKLEDLNQDLICNKDVGLLCLNSKNFPLCYNYEIRVQCCVANNKCHTTETETTESIPTVSTKVTSPPSTYSSVPTSAYSSTTSTKTTPVISTSTPSFTISSTKVTLSSSTPSTTSTSSPSTPSTPQSVSTSTSYSTSSSTSSLTTSKPTSTKTVVISSTPSSSSTTSTSTLVTTSTTCPYTMNCRYTNWIDENKPTKGRSGGEYENLLTLKSRGEQVCSESEMMNSIQCDAVETSGSSGERAHSSGEKAHSSSERARSSSEEAKEVYSCDLQNGLVCLNSKQKGFLNNQCSNYRIRILCCAKYCGPATTPPPTKSTYVVSSTTSTSTKVTSSSSTPSTTSTSTKVTSSYTPSTTSTSTKVTSSSSTPSTPHSVSTSTPSSTTSSTTTSTLTTPIVSSSSSSSSISSLTTSKPTSTTTVVTSSTPSSSSTTSTSTLVTTSTTCPYTMNCRYTNWIDENKPTKGRSGGEYENLLTLKSRGNQICSESEMMNSIQCDAVEISGTSGERARSSDERSRSSNERQRSSSERAHSSSEEAKQVYSCDLQNGLVCLNSKQKGFLNNQCSNYRIRILCCAKYCGPATTPPPTKSTYVVSSTTSTSTKVTSSSSTPSTTSTSTKVTSSYTPSTTSTSTKVTSSSSTPSTPHSVSTSTPSSTPSSTTTSTLTTPIVSSSSSSSISSLTTSKPTSTTTVVTSSTPSSSSTTSTSTLVTTSTTCPYTMNCRYTNWIDENKPTKGRSGGEYENLLTLKSRGNQICSESEMMNSIQCDAVEISGTSGERARSSDERSRSSNERQRSSSERAHSSSEEAKQVYSCDLQNGLVCLNSKQKGFLNNQCSNYRIRILCCAKYCGPATTPPPTKSTYVVSSTTSTSTKVTSSSSTPSTTSTSTKVTSSYTPSTTSTSTKVTSSSSTPSTPHSVSTSTPSSTPSSTTTSTLTTPIVSSSSLTSSLTTSKPTSTTTVVTSSTPSSSSTTSTSTLVTTSTTCPYTMNCRYTNWIDENKPTKGRSGGEYENLLTLKSRGNQICSESEMMNSIQCDAVEISGTSGERARSSDERSRSSNERQRSSSERAHSSSEEAKQVYSCDLQNGLVCLNSKQKGFLNNQCSNYRIRILCCAKYCGPATTPPPTKSTYVVSSTTSTSTKVTSSSSTPSTTSTSTKVTSSYTPSTTSTSTKVTSSSSTPSTPHSVSTSTPSSTPSSTTTSTLTTPIVSSSSSSSSISSLTTSKPTSTTTVVTSSTPSSSSTTSTSTLVTTSTTCPYTMNCRYTNWIDENKPTKGRSGGEYENLLTLKSRGNQICSESEMMNSIQCDAVEISGTSGERARSSDERSRSSNERQRSSSERAHSSSEEAKQVYSCDLQNGLVCLNSKQKGFLNNQCSNYRIRILCCAKYCGPATTPPPTKSTYVVSSTTSTSTKVTSSSSTPSTTSTSTKVTSSYTPSTTSTSTKVTSSSSTPSTPHSVSTSTPSSTPSSTTTSTLTTPIVSSSSSSSISSLTTSKPTSTTTVVTSSTPSSSSTTSTSTLVTTSTTCPYTMNCRYTNWIDENKPTKGRSGGEYENLLTLKSRGNQICSESEMMNSIQCDAVEISGTSGERARSSDERSRSSNERQRSSSERAHSSSEEAKQVYSCDLQNGLVCLNSKQKGFLNNQCSNYRIRILCCAKYCGPATTPPPTKSTYVVSSTTSTSTKVTSSSSTPSTTSTSTKVTSSYTPSTTSTSTKVTSSSSTPSTPHSVSTSTPSSTPSSTTTSTLTTPIVSSSSLTSSLTTSKPTSTTTVVTSSTPSSSSTTSTSTLVTTSTTCPYTMNCRYTNWIDENKPTKGRSGGEYENLLTLKSRGNQICSESEMMNSIQCDAVEISGTSGERARSSDERSRSSNERQRSSSERAHSSSEEAKQVYSCDLQNGLVCLNSKQKGFLNNQCSNYRIRILCCAKYCGPATTPPPTKSTYVVSSTTSTSTKVTSSSSTPSTTSTSTKVTSSYTPSTTSTSTKVTSSSSTPSTPHSVSTSTPSSTTTSTLTTPIVSSSSSSSISSLTTSKPTSTTTVVTSSTPSSSSTTSTSTLVTTSTTCPYTMNCRYTNWIDENKPTKGRSGGEYENLLTLKSRGNQICSESEMMNSIQCDAVEISGTSGERARSSDERSRSSNERQRSSSERAHSSSEEAKQVYSCDLQNGLVCLNSKQKGFLNNQCSNYRIRILCCAKYCGPATTPPPTKSTYVVSSTTSTSTKVTSSSSTPSTTSTSTKVTSSYTPSTTSTSTKVTSSSSTPSTPHSVSTSTPSSTPSSTTTSTLTTPIVSSSSLTSSLTTSKPTSTTTVVTSSTPSSSSTTSTSTLVTTSTTCPYTMNCRYTNWIDENKPTKGRSGGEYENLLTLKSRGNQICSESEMMNSIQCDAVEISGTSGERARSSDERSRSSNERQRSSSERAHSSSEEAKQVYSCDLQNGLVCLNSKQKGFLNNQCSNYRIRILCCAKYCGPATTPPPTKSTYVVSSTTSTSTKVTSSSSTPSTTSTSTKVTSSYTPSTTSTSTKVTSSSSTPSTPHSVSTSTPSSTTTSTLTTPIVSSSSSSSISSLTTSKPTSTTTVVTSSTPSSSSTTSTSTLVTTSTTCPYTMNCRYTNWIDENKPTKGRSGGEYENLLTLKSRGNQICSESEMMNSIQCDAVEISGTSGEKARSSDERSRSSNERQRSSSERAHSSSEEAKQVYSCDLQNGLVCLNSKQKGFLNNQCSNYRIRILCCAKYCGPATTPPPTKSTYVVSSTTSTSTKVTSSSSTPSTTSTSTKVTSSYTPSTTSTSTKVTSSSSTPSTPHSVSTSTPSSTPSSTTTSTLTTPIVSSSSSSSISSLTTSKPTSTTTVVTSSTPSSSSTTSTSTLVTTSTTCPYTMNCRYTNWIDENKPTKGRSGGEYENLLTLKSRGNQICSEREMMNSIQCDAVEISGTSGERARSSDERSRSSNERQRSSSERAHSSSEEAKQVYSCDLQNGLVCLNSKQKGFLNNQCSNYRIRILCCAKYCGPATTPPPTKSTYVVSSTTSTSTKVTSSSSTPSTTSTSTKVTSSYTPSTTSTSTKVTSSSSTPSTPHSVSTSTPSSTPSSTTTSTLTTPIVSSSSLTSSLTTSKPTSTTTVVTSSTPSSSSTTSTSTLVTTSTTCPYTMNCRYTNWIDENKPTKGRSGGEYENLLTLKSRGNQICSESEMMNSIQCDAVEISGTSGERARSSDERSRSSNERQRSSSERAHSSSEEAKQVYSCDLQNGLVCLNSKQKGFLNNQCSNYRIRILCCAKYCGPATTPPPTKSTYVVSSTTSTSTKVTSSSSTPSTTSTSTKVSSSSSTPSTPHSVSTSTPYSTPSSTTTSTITTPIISTSSSTSSLTTSKPTSTTTVVTSSTPSSSSTTSTSTLVTTLATSSSYTPSTTSTSTEVTSSLSTPSTPHSVSTSTPSSTPSSTTTSTLTTPFVSSSSLTSSLTTSKPTSTTTVVTSSTPSSSSTTSTSTLVTTSTTCPYTMNCRYTNWIDENKPTKGRSGGEYENLLTLKSRGNQICSESEMMNSIQCDAVEISGTSGERARSSDERSRSSNERQRSSSERAHSSSEEAKQVYSCDLQNGLVCLNSKQKGFLNNQCSNYRIRILCCAKYCGPATTPPPTKSTYVVSSTTSTSTKVTSSSSTPSTTSTSTKVTSSSSTPSTPHSVSTSTPSSTPSSTTTSTLTTPIVSSSSLTSSLTTSKPTSTTTVVTSSTPSSSSTTSTSTLVTTLATSSSYTPSTTSTSTEVTSSLSTPSTPHSVSTSTPSSTPSSTTTSTLTTPIVSSSSLTSSLTTSKPTSTTTVVTSSTPSSSSTTSTSTLVTTSTTCPYTMNCRYTNWIDENKPTKGRSGGEYENLLTLKSRGNQICSESEMMNSIQCDAVEISGTSGERARSSDERSRSSNERQRSSSERAHSSSEEAKQVYSCDLQNGLVCLNSKQKGFLNNQCSNYRIRIECCTKFCGPPTTPPPTKSTYIISSTTSTSTVSTKVTLSSTPSTKYSVSTSPPYSTTTSTKTTTSVSTSSLSTAMSSSFVTITSTSGTTSSPVSTSLFSTSSTSSTSNSTPLSTTVSQPFSSSKLTTLPVSSETTPPTLSTIYSTVSTSTSCFCQVNQSLFSPGDIIYRTVDNAGCEYYAKCSSQCQPERYVGDCISTSAPTTISVPTISGFTTPNVSTNTTSVISTTTTSSTIPVTSVPECGECVCQMPKCGSGYRVVSFLPPGACCVNITCVPDSVCVVGTDVYQRGSVIPQPKDACQTCLCSSEMDMNAEFYAVKCTPNVCQKTCSQGYQYREKSGQCCGECVPIQCTMKKDNNTSVDIKIGETYRTNISACSYYECEEENGVPVLTKVKKVCQTLDLTKCDLSTLAYDEEGCCRTCKPITVISATEQPKVIEDCSVRKNVTVLKQDDCVAQVELTYCGGPCMGSSMYSIATKSIDHKCTCCTQREVGQKTVQLLCANGRRLSYTYTDVISCGCAGATCTPEAGLSEKQKYSKESQSHSQESQSHSQESQNHSRESQSQSKGRQSAQISNQFKS